MLRLQTVDSGAKRSCRLINFVDGTRVHINHRVFLDVTEMLRRRNGGIISSPFPFDVNSIK